MIKWDSPRRRRREGARFDHFLWEYVGVPIVGTIIVVKLEFADFLAITLSMHPKGYTASQLYASMVPMGWKASKFLRWWGYGGPSRISS